MFGLDYKDLYQKIKHRMKDPDISVDMKRALLELQVGLMKVENEELKECSKEGLNENGL